MSARQRRINVVTTDLSAEPAIGQWLWALEDGRSRTMEELEGVTDAMIDWLPPDGGSTIATILYHMAGIEADWLYEEVVVSAFPAEVDALLSFDIRDQQGRLTQVQGLRLDQLLTMLARVHALLLDVYRQMDLAEFRRIRVLPDYDVTPEWVLHHIMQHEAEHRSQIIALRTGARRTPAVT